MVIGIWLSDFLHNTPYRDLLPPKSMFFAHPFTFVRRWYEVYDMHVAYVSAQTAERRKQKVEDVKKRDEYRKAHGLDQGDGILGGWTAKTDAEVMGPGMREGSVNFTQSPGSETSADTVHNVVGQAGKAEQTYVDFEGKTQPVKKKWFGIW